MLTGMELRHLRYFVAVALEQNVTRAAMRLRVAQPSLSRQIRDLECEIGFALFDHGARAVRLTEAGRTFLTEAEAVLKHADQAVRNAKAVANGERGEVHVGYAPSLTVTLLPRALRLFQETSPSVRVHLHDLSTEEMLCGLRDGEIQVALMIRPPDRSLSRLEFEELRSHAVCVAVPPTHRFARSKSVRLAHVAQESLIGYSRAEYPEYHEWLAGLFAAEDRTPDLVEEHDSSTSLIAAVEAGHGVALIQKGFHFLAGQRVKIRPLSPAPPPFVVGVAWRKENLSPAAANFIQSVRHAKDEHAGAMNGVTS